MPAIVNPRDLSALKRKFRSQNGKLFFEDGWFSVTHHDTTVVKFDPRRICVFLNNGGWNSVTTRQRINKALMYFGFPLRIVSRKYVWYVETPYGEITFKNGGRFTGDGFALD